MQPAVPENNSRWTRRALLGFAFAAPFLALYLSRTNLVIALAPLFISHLLLLYATLVPNCQWWGPVIRSFHTTQPEVWITIDDGPSPAHTTKILDLLERFNARATFFVVGTARGRISAPHHGNPQSRSRDRQSYLHAPKWDVLGGWSGENRGGNRSLRGMAPKRTGSSGAVVPGAGGFEEFVCAPRTGATRTGLDRLDGPGLDTVQREPVLVAEKILREAKAGAIILLHEGHRVAKDPEFNPRCLELTLSGLAERGYQCVIPQPEQFRTRDA